MTAHQELDAPGSQRTAARRGTGGLPWWQAIGIGAVAATVINLVVLAIGNAAGASFVYVDAGATGQVTAGSVIMSSTLPLIIGTGLAAVIARWWPGVIRVAQVVGAGLALVTIAGVLTMQTDGGTQVALSVMHFVIAPVVVGVLEAGRRRRLV